MAIFKRQLTGGTSHVPLGGERQPGPGWSIRNGVALGTGSLANILIFGVLPALGLYWASVKNLCCPNNLFQPSNTDICFCHAWWSLANLSSDLVCECSTALFQEGIWSLWRVYVVLMIPWGQDSLGQSTARVWAQVLPIRVAKLKWSLSLCWPQFPNSGAGGVGPTGSFQTVFPGHCAKQLYFYLLGFHLDLFYKNVVTIKESFENYWLDYLQSPVWL